MGTSVRPHETPDHATAPAVAREREGDVVVLRPVGSVDDAMLNALRAMIHAADEPVIVDLDDCAVVTHRGLHGISATPQPYDDDVRIVCRRLSGRRLLARLGITNRFAVFDRLPDALAAAKASRTAARRP